MVDYDKYNIQGKKLIIPLHEAIVGPHLEYYIQAWRGLRDLSYEERLKEYGLTTVETRRIRRHQTEVFKILNGYENIDRNIVFSLKKDSRTIGHE